MKMVGVQHIGIAVKDLEATIATLEKLFGIKCGKREKIEASKVEVAFFDFGNTTVELVSPTHPDSPISKYLEKRGNGIHHICFDVEGIDDWLGITCPGWSSPWATQPLPPGNGISASGSFIIISGNGSFFSFCNIGPPYGPLLFALKEKPYGGLHGSGPSL